MADIKVDVGEKVDFIGLLRRAKNHEKGAKECIRSRLEIKKRKTLNRTMSAALLSRFFVEAIGEPSISGSPM